MNARIIFSSDEIDVLSGALLGDGHIDLKGRSSCFSYGSSRLEHVLFVFNFLKRFVTPRYQQGPVKYDFFDKRTKKTYTRFYFKTQSNISLFELRRRWYPNNIKIIPPDITLSPLKALLWYIGDGYLNKNYIKLSTDGFDTGDISILINLLRQFDPYTLNNRIYIPRHFIRSFLSYIGPCPVSCYNYKWDTTNISNSPPPSSYEDIYPNIIKEFLAGSSTIYFLSKKYNVPITCIKNHFNKKNISWAPINNKKRIAQYDLLGNLIKVWESGQEIKRELNFNTCCISECCRNNRKHYNNFIWRFV